MPPQNKVDMEYKLTEKDYLDLWKYFQEKATSVKGAMFQTITWIIGFAAALLAFGFAKVTDFDPSKAVIPLPWLMVGISIAGFFICSFAFLALNESAKHIKRNWDYADNCLRNIKGLSEIVSSQVDFLTKVDRKEKPMPVWLKRMRIWLKRILICLKLILIWLKRILIWLKPNPIWPKHVQIWNQLRILVGFFLCAFIIIIANCNFWQDAEKRAREPKLSITAHASQIEIPKIIENLDSTRSAAQRATEAAKVAVTALAVIEENRKQDAATSVWQEKYARSHMEAINKLLDQISHAGDLQVRLVRLEALVASLMTESQLTRNQWKTIQRSLKARGFKPGEIDGRLGPSTVIAIREYQKRRSDHPDVTGVLTADQLDDLLK
jgi:hypothetical protein